MTKLLEKTALNLVLIAAFCVMIMIVIRPLSAELRFSAAKDLVKHYKWVQAEKEFRNAITLDPFNSYYSRELGNFLYAQSGYYGYREPMLREAEGFFRRAIDLDPRDAESWVKLGLIEMHRAAYGKAFENFRRAAADDPNGFRTSYDIGLSGLGAWNDIGESDKLFVVGRLKAAMMARPSGDIYTKAWNARKDIGLLRAITADDLESQRGLYDFIISHDLWQFRKAQAARVGYYMKDKAPAVFASREADKAGRAQRIKAALERRSGPKRVISAADWYGSAIDGKSMYENGNMYWSGTMNALIDSPKGDVILKIRAKGQSADAIYPYMIIELDNKEIGETFVDSIEWKEYEFKIHTDGGSKVLSVTFANDSNNAKEDRNLFVGSAEIVKSDR